MGNRATESKKRSNRAFGLAIRCYLAGGGCRLPDSDCPDVRSPELCDRHRCTATTRRGTRCCNSATYPEQRSCGVHLPGEASVTSIPSRVPGAQHTTTSLTEYGELVRSFDHARLATLPAYQALRQALSDIGNQSADAGGCSLAGFLEAVRDMALTAVYGDCCPRCGVSADMAWPYAAVRDGQYIRGRYRCPQGHTWTCNYHVDISALI